MRPARRGQAPEFALCRPARRFDQAGVAQEVRDLGHGGRSPVRHLPETRQRRRLVLAKRRQHALLGVGQQQHGVAG